MQFLPRVAFVLSLLPGFAFAQEGDAPKTATKPPMVVSLAAGSGVVKLGQPLVLELAIDMNEAGSLPATALGGYEIETSVDGAKSTTLREPAPGTVKVAAGTSIRRSITIDTSRHWPEASLRGKQQIALSWVGLAGAEATVRIVADQSGIDLAKLDYAKTKVRFITSKGEIVIGFLPEVAPRHVENFVKLSKDGFYDGTRFHRVIRGFMVQGGCPNTKRGATGMPGTGSPGWTVRAEFNETKHVKGIVSMARAAGEDTAGSQFFLMHGDAPHLDGKYSAFGMIEQGIDVLDLIADTTVMPSRMGETSVPTEDLWLWAAVVEPAFKE